MPGRHTAAHRSPAAVAPGLRRLGVLAAATTAVAGSGVAALTGSAVAAPAMAAPTPVAHPVAAAPTVSSVATGRMAVAEARKHLGAPYRFGAEGPSAFDCSGLTQYVYGKVGRTLPRSAAQQQDAVRPVPRAAMQPGDLIFQGRNAHHVAIYAGNGRMITAPESGENVKMDALPRTFTAGRP